MFINQNAFCKRDRHLCNFYVYKYKLSPLNLQGVNLVKSVFGAQTSI